MKTYTCWGNNKIVTVEAHNTKGAQAACMERYGFFPDAIKEGNVYDDRQA